MKHSLPKRILYAGLGSTLALMLIVAANPRFKPAIEGLADSGWMWFWIALTTVIWFSLVALAICRDAIDVSTYFTSGFIGPGLPYLALDAFVKWVK